MSILIIEIFLIAKIVQARAMKTCFQIAERRQSYLKIVQARAMKTCFQIAERRQSSAKIMQNADNSKIFDVFILKNNIMYCSI